ncbi:MAG: DUF2958 domain-containing protein [Nitrosopumilaceae archaeon]|nr:DUF2958 domain-containing protein [Nitrosopumilaceae archaeon]NIU01274.1 DUF2958 domain-containing protein [Nitrosopumilaceae archaeon]NIU87622.1 DUF2958 domain-containing protein [Nitrosopumilaceae archaeon]NIV66047.1 DUF2958 domain-containing protein [Nitrosopumilaceae archaeon]NIX61876.1 DUF2958 domain-containing protein [Nitrosopumilaceae archaeon]
MTSGDWITEDYVPKIYETENIPLEKKIIYQKWDIERIGFYWLIAELDKKNDLAFGYANLNDEQNAEWGYISVKELINNGAERDRKWKPVEFREALKIVKEYRKRLNH